MLPFEFCQRLAIRRRGNNPAAPASEQTAGAVQHQSSSSTTTIELAAQRVGRCSRATGGSRPGRSATHRHRDVETRAFAGRGVDADRMLEQGAQAFDDGEPEPQPVALVRIRRRDLIEFAENVALLILGNADAAVADLDAQLFAARAGNRARCRPLACSGPRWTPRLSSMRSSRMGSLRTQALLGTTRSASPFSRAAAANVASIALQQICSPGSPDTVALSAPASSLEMSSSALNSSFMLPTASVDPPGDPLALGLIGLVRATARRTGPARAAAGADRGSPRRGSATWRGWRARSWWVRSSTLRSSVA